MTASPITQDTTPTTLVRLPDLPMAQYRRIVAAIQHERPSERKRIGSSLNVLLGSAIYETERVGEYLVQSCQDGGTYYRTSTFTCTCPDSTHRAPFGRCKHVIALDVLHTATAVARYEQLQARAASR